MGGFGVRHYDGEEHYFSVLSPEDLSVSKSLSLPFDKGEYVRGGSCGGLLYFHGEKDKIVIVNLTTNESIVVPPPDFEPDPHKGELRASGLGYDAKSGDYKVIRHYVQLHFDTPDEDGIDRHLDCKYFFELYRFKSFGSWKELRRPRSTSDVFDAGVYVGETGSCYWVGHNSLEELGECMTTYKQLVQQGTVFDGSVDSMFMHVVSFDFATESFGRFPLPASGMGLNVRCLLVGYCGSLGVVNYVVSNTSFSELSFELFVRKGEGRSWERVYDVVYINDAEIPVGLKDNRLFLEAKPGDDERSQLMVYDFDTKKLEKLNIYNYDYSRRMSVISYGAESTDPPLPDSIPKADYDFSRKMRTSKKAKGKKKSGKGKKSRW